MLRTISEVGGSRWVRQIFISLYQGEAAGLLGGPTMAYAYKVNIEEPVMCPGLRCFLTF